MLSKQKRSTLTVVKHNSSTVCWLLLKAVPDIFCFEKAETFSEILEASLAVLQRQVSSPTEPAVKELGFKFWPYYLLVTKSWIIDLCCLSLSFLT